MRLKKYQKLFVLCAFCSLPLLEGCMAVTSWGDTVTIRSRRLRVSGRCFTVDKPDKSLTVSVKTSSESAYLVVYPTIEAGNLEIIYGESSHFVTATGLWDFSNAIHFPVVTPSWYRTLEEDGPLIQTLTFIFVDDVPESAVLTLDFKSARRVNRFYSILMGKEECLKLIFRTSSDFKGSVKLEVPSNWYSWEMFKSE